MVDHMGCRIISLKLLADLISSLSSLLLSGVSSDVQLVEDPVPAALDVLSNLSEDGLSRGGGAVFVVSILSPGKGAELVDGGTLRDRNAIAVKVVLELAVAPGLESLGLGTVGGLSQIAGHRSKGITTGRRSGSVGGLSSTEKLVASSTGLLSDLLGCGVTVVGNVLLQVVISVVVKSPGAVASRGLVGMLADKSTELIDLGSLGNGNTTSVKITLQTGLRPSVDSLVKGILVLLGGSIGGLGVVLANVGGSSAISGSSRSGNGVSHDVGTVLANKSAKLVNLGALGNVDAVLVAELLELRLAPRVDELVGQVVVSSFGTGLALFLLLLGLEVSETGVAANRGNELVSLWNVLVTSNCVWNGGLLAVVG